MHDHKHSAAGSSLNSTTKEALAWLRSNADQAILDAMGPRYGIHTERALGVPMNQMKTLARQLGTDHELALNLWDTGWYEARVVAAMVDDAQAVTTEQMESWVEDFDNWAIVDTVCFNLFDRTPHAWDKVDEWACSREEFTKRAGFALIWSLTGHDPDAADERFLHALVLIEENAGDGRPLVDKAIGMALRAIGKRKPQLAPATKEVAMRLAALDVPSAKAIGRSAMHVLTESSA